MSHPLDGCWAKIERANENIESLRSEIAAFASSDDYRISREVNNQVREYIFRAFGPETPVPLRFSVLAGEIIHHLRSSLDHLIWALVLRRHPTPDFKVQFPICASEEKFVAARKGGIIKGVTGSAQTLIERCQPYFKATARCPDPPNHALMILHDLSNTDKHTLLVVVSINVCGPSSLTFTAPAQIADAKFVQCIPERWPRNVRPTKDGAEILRVRLDFRMHPDVQVKGDFPFDVAFEKFGTLQVEPVIPSLVKLRDAVVQTLNLFSGEF